MYPLLLIVELYTVVCLKLMERITVNNIYSVVHQYAILCIISQYIK